VVNPFGKSTRGKEQSLAQILFGARGGGPQHLGRNGGTDRTPEPRGDKDARRGGCYIGLCTRVIRVRDMSVLMGGEYASNPVSGCWAYIGAREREARGDRGVYNSIDAGEAT